LPMCCCVIVKATFRLKSVDEDPHAIPIKTHLNHRVPMKDDHSHE
jgi:hypothetical protein